MSRRAPESVRVALWEGRMALRSLRDGEVRSFWWELDYARSKVREALARDVAWALPRDVALMAFVRVAAAATTGPWSGTHPDEVTYKLAHDRWTRDPVEQAEREKVEAGTAG